jgi:hypothetical protein
MSDEAAEIARELRKHLAWQEGEKVVLVPITASVTAAPLRSPSPGLRPPSPDGRGIISGLRRAVREISVEPDARRDG